MARFGSIWGQLGTVIALLVTNLLSVQVVSAVQYAADTGRAAVCQKGKSTRSTRRISHHDARINLAVLRHVGAESVWCELGLNTA